MFNAPAALLAARVLAEPPSRARETTADAQPTLDDPWREPFPAPPAPVAMRPRRRARWRAPRPFAHLRG